MTTDTISTSLPAVLFLLSGGGDTQFFLAPPSALEWCDTVKPGNHTIPDEVAEQMKPFMDLDSKGASLTDEVYITSGSADNDAALFLAGFLRNFDSARAAIKYASAQGWSLEDEYHGCIY